MWSSTLPESCPLPPRCWRVAECRPLPRSCRMPTVGCRLGAGVTRTEERRQFVRVSRRRIDSARPCLAIDCTPRAHPRLGIVHPDGQSPSPAHAAESRGTCRPPLLAGRAGRRRHTGRYGPTGAITTAAQSSPRAKKRCCEAVISR